MKKVGKILCILIIAVLIAIMIISNNASAEGCKVNLSASPSSVSSGQEVKIKMELSGNKAIMLNATLTYNKNMFTYKEATLNASGGQFNANESEDGIAVIFVGQLTDENSYSLTSITFSFTVNEGITEQTEET